MNRFRSLLWLCRRVLLRRVDWRLTVTVMVGTFVLSLLAISSVSVPFALAHQSERSDALQPVVKVDSAADDENSLRLIDPQITNVRRWDGYEITRYFYIPGNTPMVAPGIPEMPGVGEYFASPGLVELLDGGNSVVEGLFKDQVLVGEIGEDGLAQPHELTAIVGAELPSVAVVEVTAFGQSVSADPVQAQEQRTGLNRFIAFLVVAIVWLPAVAFLVIVSRLSAGQRQLRARALRLVGMSWVGVRSLVAIEMTLLALPGALTGLLLYFLVRDSVSSVPGTTLGFFPADTEVPLWLLLVAAAMPLAVTAALTALTLSQDSLSGAKGRRSFWFTTDRVGRLILSCGVGLLVVVPFVGGMSPLGAPALWTGSALVAGGLGLAGPAVVSMALSRLASKVRGGGSLVGLRVASRSSPSSMRLGSLMGIVVILLLAGTAFQNVLNGGSSTDWDRRLLAEKYAPTVVTDLLETLTIEGLRRTDPNAPVAEQASLNLPGEPIPVVIATCADLAGLSGGEVDDCTGAPQWISPRPESSSVRDAAADALDDTALQDGAPVLNLKNAPESFAGSLLVPSERRAGLAVSGGSFFVLASSERLKQSLAEMSSAAPATQFDLGSLDRHNPDTQNYPEQIEWLTIGSSVSLLIGLLAMLAVAVGDTRDRARNAERLRMLGAPRHELVSAHFWAVGSPIVGMGVLATGLGWLTAYSMHGLDDRADYSLTTIAAVAGAITVGAVVVCLATWSDTGRTEGNRLR